MTTAAVEKLQLTIPEDARRRRADFQSADAWHELLIKAGTYEATVEGGYLRVTVDTVILETMYVNKLGSAQQADHQFPNEASTYTFGMWAFDLQQGGILRVGQTADGENVDGWIGGVGEDVPTAEQVTALRAALAENDRADRETRQFVPYSDPQYDVIRKDFAARGQALIAALRSEMQGPAK